MDFNNTKHYINKYPDFGNPFINDNKIKVEIINNYIHISLNQITYIIDKADTIEAQRVFLECLYRIIFK